jgi:hypothetical protein
MSRPIALSRRRSRRGRKKAAATSTRSKSRDRSCLGSPIQCWSTTGRGAFAINRCNANTSRKTSSISPTNGTKSGTKSIGKRTYPIAPATNSLSVVETRTSASSPPISRRKFGSSFIVEITVRFGPALGPVTDGASASLAREAARAAPAPGRRGVLFLRDDPALARADCVFTCADLPVAELAEPGPWTPRSAQPDQHFPPGEAAVASTKPRTSLPQRSPLQLTCQR